MFSCEFRQIFYNTIFYRASSLVDSYVENNSFPILFISLCLQATASFD